MNKKELVTSIASKSGLTKKDSEKMLNAFIESVTEVLQNNEKIQILGFGTFEMKERAAGEKYNPRTKTKEFKEAVRYPVMKLSKVYKDIFN